jgi:hypothetical protein
MTAPAVFVAPAVPDYQIDAVYIGPTWQRGDDGRFVLPEYTLGWQILRWINEYLLGPDGGPWTPTKEQARFLLWWYAIDENGRFVYRDGIFQRLKGHGKDPLIAVICLVEMLGPCRFDDWATEPIRDWDIDTGDPIGRENPSAWIQVAAVSEKQTKNTMTLFAGMISKKLMQAHGMTKLDIGKSIIYAHGGARQIEAVTSSPRALEGGRPTFIVRNETHHWLEANGGHDMAEVIERNATKSAHGASRAISITNAYDPSEDSVAQRQREAWEAEQEEGVVDTRVLYDSIEAPESVTMRPPEAVEWKKPAETKEEREWREACTRAWLTAIVRSVRGDSVWLDIPSIVDAILSVRTAAHTARRFWFNNIVAAADSWADPAAIDAAIDPILREDRLHEREGDQLRLGWVVSPDDPIVMFFDGSKSDDSTGLVGCRLSDGYTFTIGIWSKPPGKAGEDWLSPREAVNERVDEAFTRFNVVAFWADPSHTLDDDSTRYWDGYIDRWHRTYKERLQTWAVQSGVGVSSVMWDMANRLRTAQFTAAAELVRSELHHRDSEGHYEPLFRHDGHPALRAHLRNARENRGPDGVSIRKNNRESAKKIDLAACLIGARLLRRVVLNQGIKNDEKVGGWVTAI